MPRKIHIIYCTIIVFFILSIVFIYYRNLALEKQSYLLQYKESALENKLSILEQSNAVYRNEIKSLSHNVEIAKEETKVAKAKLSKLPKPQIITKIESNEKVIELITKYYDDSTAKYINDHFEICTGTTFKLVEDGVNWKVNYPIYQDLLKQNEIVINKLDNESNSKTLLINKKDQLIVGLEDTNKAHRELDENLRNQLKVEKKKTKIKVISAAILGALIKTGIDSLRKK